LIKKSAERQKKRQRKNKDVKTKEKEGIPDQARNDKEKTKTGFFVTHFFRSSRMTRPSPQ
jgi:hypothetical protein